MGKNRKDTKAKTESFAETFLRYFKEILSLILSVYMLLILVVLPFYNEAGYAHIGTDKSMFFRSVATKCGMFLLPVLGLVLLLKLFILWREFSTAGKQRKDFWSLKWTEVKNYCRTEISVTDYFAFGYGVTVVISYLLSRYKGEALWGTSGWYMGMLPHLILIFSYFMISRAWKQQKMLLLLVFPVSAVVFVLGYLNRFGISPIDMKVESVAFISTIGNINWYCGYVVSVFFAGFYLLWRKDVIKVWQQLLLIIYVSIGFATLVTNGSSSGIVAMAGIILLTFCLSASDAKRMEAFWLEMCLLSLVCVVTYLLRKKEILTITYMSEVTEIFTNSKIGMLMLIISVVGFTLVKLTAWRGHYPKKLFSILAIVGCIGSAGILVLYFVVLFLNTKSNGELLQGTILADNPFFIFSATWGSNRGATYTAGVGCFREQDFIRRLFGVGPDCMAAFLAEDASSELVASVKERFGEARLTNAHNEWLTILVCEGVVGFICFVGMMITAIKRYIGCYKQNVVVAACGFCLLAYTINNMFSFQTSMSVSTIFIVMAVGENYLRNEKKNV